MSKNEKNEDKEAMAEVLPEDDNNVTDEAEKAENDAGEAEVDVEKLREENRKFKEEYLRAYAEVENTKKRCQQEIDKNNKYAIASFAKNLLAVADNLQRAIDAADGQDDESCEALLKGVRLTQSELAKVFAKFDIKKMEIMGTIFDPNFHQVIQEVEDNTKPAGTIVAEVQTGYMIHDRILREAMVVVTKA